MVCRGWLWEDRESSRPQKRCLCHSGSGCKAEVTSLPPFHGRNSSYQDNLKHIWCSCSNRLWYFFECFPEHSLGWLCPAHTFLSVLLFLVSFSHRSAFTFIFQKKKKKKPTSPFSLNAGNTKTLITSSFTSTTVPRLCVHPASQTPWEKAYITILMSPASLSEGTILYMESCSSVCCR